MREAKIRTIYNNYNLYDDLHDAALESIRDNEGEDCTPTDDELWEEIYSIDEVDWDCEKMQMESFFGNGTYILIGTIGRWDGPRAGGFVFQGFDEMFSKIAKDCDYFHFYDKNGHFYIECSHHDGTNEFEIRKLTERGIQMYERWKYSFGDPRCLQDVHASLFGNSYYSVLPNYAHKVFGVPKQEWLPKTA